MGSVTLRHDKARRRCVSLTLHRRILNRWLSGAVHIVGMAVSLSVCWPTCIDTPGTQIRVAWCNYIWMVCFSVECRSDLSPLPCLYLAINRAHLRNMALQQPSTTRFFNYQTHGGVVNGHMIIACMLYCRLTVGAKRPMGEVSDTEDKVRAYSGNIVDTLIWDSADADGCTSNAVIWRTIRVWNSYGCVYICTNLPLQEV